MPTHESSSLPKVLDTTTIDFPRFILDVNERIVVKALDLIDPWLQISLFEDG